MGADLFRFATGLMLGSAVLMLLCAVLAYGFEAELSLATLIALHIAQVPLAGVFKLAYVLRLASQQHRREATSD